MECRAGIETATEAKLGQIAAKGMDKMADKLGIGTVPHAIIDEVPWVLLWCCCGSSGLDRGVWGRHSRLSRAECFGQVEEAPQRSVSLSFWCHSGKCVTGL